MKTNVATLTIAASFLSNFRVVILLVFHYANARSPLTPSQHGYETKVDETD